MMINTVALRTDFAGDPAFRDVLARFRRTAAAAIDNQDAPYDKVILRLQSAPGTDLFSCFFDSYDQAFPAYRNEHVQVETVDGIGNGTMQIRPDRAGHSRATERRRCCGNTTPICSPVPTAERMMRHFLALVAASVARPDLPVSRLPILSADEREHLLQLGRGP